MVGLIISPRFILKVPSSVIVFIAFNSSIAVLYFGKDIILEKAYHLASKTKKYLTEIDMSVREIQKISNKNNAL